MTFGRLRSVALSLGIPENRLRSIVPFICEEDGSEYSVWKLETDDGCYVMKPAKDLEAECYRSFFREKRPYAPEFLGSANCFGEEFILLEYCEGETLRLEDTAALYKAVDALAEMQNEFWQRDELYGCGVTMDRALKRIDDWGNYLGTGIITRAYSGFRRVYEIAPRTLCHEDLLPINVLVGDRAVLIDWEVGGILPYLSSFARLVAHGRDDRNAEFYMRTEDLEPVVQYYYRRLAEPHGIEYGDYRRTLDWFLFFEYCEWVMLGNRYGAEDDGRYSWYLKKAEEAAGRLLSE